MLVLWLLFPGDLHSMQDTDRLSQPCDTSTSAKIRHFRFAPVRAHVMHDNFEAQFGKQGQCITTLFIDKIVLHSNFNYYDEEYVLGGFGTKDSLHYSRM